MELEEYLGIFDLKKPGGNESFSIGYDALCREIEKLSPDVCGGEIVAKLDELEYLRVLPNGARSLTELGVAKRIPLPARPVPAPAKSNPAAWEKFRLLCAYYIDCVTFSEKSQDVLFSDKLNESFVVPALGSGWIDGDKEIRLSPTDKQCAVLNMLFAQQQNGEEGIFIGYPLNAWRNRNAQALCLSPIFLFPVDMERRTRGEFSVRIRRGEVSLNQSWVENKIGRAERRGFSDRIYSTACGNDGVLDVGAALQVVAKRLSENLDPNEAGTDAITKIGTQNNAALFVGTALKYSKNLVRELKLIKEQSPEVLDKTALAYVFRDPPIENAFSQKPIGVPVEFMPCNAEQLAAVRQGLTLPVSKVKGPPGTGKTYVAVNLMANLVFHNQSVLFTSKNHTAIDAIRDKAETVASGFVRFCKTPDGSDNPWWRVDLEGLRGELDVARRQLGDPQKIEENNANIVRALEDFRDAEEKIAAIDEFRAKMQERSAARERIENRLRSEYALPEECFLEEKFSLDVASLASRLFDPERSRGLFQKILDALFRRKRRGATAAVKLRTLVPSLASEKYNSIATLKSRAQCLCENLARYHECARELDELCPSDKSGEKILQEKRAESDELMAFLSEAHKILSAENAKMAMVSRHASAVEKMSDADKNNWRNAQRFLDYSAERQHEMEVAFLAFLKFLPAWACTLLSLRNASPCFPAIFDRVIIDEAAQCDIPAIIPALFRAKGLTIIGDEAQFPPVIDLAELRHEVLLHRHKMVKIEYARFFYTKNTAHGIINQAPVWLREHFRCDPKIVDYFGNEYYGGRLKVRTDKSRLNFPKNCGFDRAYEWRDVSDSRDGEIESVVALMNDLAKNKYAGTIGVISPLREICWRLKNRLYGLQQCFDRDKFDVNADVNTANGFQGGERDLIIFVLGWTSDLTRGQLWYITSQENKYIYNVAVSRARACLIIVGDRSRAERAQEPWLQRLARPVRSRREEIDPRSPGERLLYAAMLKNGLDPKPQYPLVRRRLDLALVEAKIDVEVDGEAYHLNKFGERKVDDVWRDLQVMYAGWTVVRFWHREVMADAAACARKIAEEVARGNESRGENVCGNAENRISSGT